MDAFNISYSTIGSSAVSTCRFYLIAGTINQNQFCYLCHSSKFYEPPDFNVNTTIKSIIEDIISNITNLHIFRPREHAPRSNDTARIRP
jgi:hypothetical protein